MKVKATPDLRVQVEVQPEEAEFPPVAVPDLALRRILVPTDFSEPSRKALQYAIALGKQFRAEISLVHVVQIIPPPPPMGGIMEGQVPLGESREEAVQLLREWRARAGLSEGLKTLVRTGPPEHGIVQTAAEINADLIVISTHGRSGLAHLLIGSTAEKVVRHAPCPVLVLRERGHDFLVSNRGAGETI